MTENSTRTGSLIAGLALVIFGGLLLLGQVLGTSPMRYLWPFFIIAVGALFFAGMFTREREAGVLAIPGTMLVVLGLVFLYQVITGHWSSWAYIWALIAPTGTGIGLIIYGWWSGRPNLRQAGMIVTLVGLVIFLVFGAFFELMTGMLGFVTPGRFLWPVALVVVGVLLLFGKGLLRLLPTPPTRTGTWPAATPPPELPAETKPAALDR